MASTRFDLSISFKADNSELMKGRVTVLHMIHCRELIYILTKYNQNISKDIKVME